MSILIPTVASEHGSTSEAVDISVLIPCLNATNTLIAQLNALAHQCCDVRFEILVSDNGSTDGSQAVVRAFAKENPQLSVRLVDSSDRRGVCRARNVGIANARSEYIAICDADDIVCDTWVQAMFEGLCQRPIVAAVMSLERVNPDWVIEAFKWKSSALEPVFNFLPAQAGWGLGVRRSFHQLIGEFDETFLRQGDIDYSWKAQLCGEQFFIAEGALVYYRIKASSGSKFLYAFRDGRSTYRLFERYGMRGMPRPENLDSRHALVRCLKRTLRERDPGSRLKEIHNLGRMLGYQFQKLASTLTRRPGT